MTGGRSFVENAFARFGYVTRGVLYSMMGVLVVRLARGVHQARGETADPLGSLKAIAHEPFGRFQLVVVAAGLCAFSLWRLVQAVADSDHLGRKPSALAKRFVLGTTGLLYAPLAVAAIRFLMDGTHAIPGDQQREKLLLAWRWGPAAVLVVACVILAVALGEVWVAAKATFVEELELSKLSRAWRRVVVTSGRIGFAAHASVFAVLGAFLFRAATHADASKTKGIDTALLELSTDQNGALLVACIGAGLLCFGAFSFLMARYKAA